VVVSQDYAEALQNPWFGADVAGTYTEGEVIDALAFENGWISFNSDNGAAYMPVESVAVIQAEGLVCQDIAYLLDEPTPFGQVTRTAGMGEVMNIIGYYGDYYAVDIGGETLYAHRRDVLGTLLSYLGEYGPTPMVLNLDIAGQQYAAADVQFVDYAPNRDMIVTNTTDGLNIRTSPSAEAEVLLCVPNGNYLQVLEYGTDWHYVSYAGVTGFVSNKYTEYTGDGDYFALMENAVPLGAFSTLGSQAIDYAKQFIGTRYVYGGTSLTKGVDCSGFVYSVFKYIGVNLNRSARDQFKNGTAISKSELQTGDLVFFATGGGRTISHVGIYIGDGEFIHSSSSNKRGIVISNLNDSYYVRTYANACRVLN
jgi:hypothetical protein